MNKASKSRRLLAIFELLGLIISVLILIAVCLTFVSATGDNTDQELKDKVERLDNEFEGMKVQVDEWKEFSQDINLELEGDKKEDDEKDKNKRKDNNKDKEDKNKSEEDDDVIIIDDEEEDEDKEEQKTSTTEVNADELNVRSDASTDAGIVTTINSGTVVELTGKTTDSGGYNWTQVKLSDGSTGWVVSSYLK